jgi:ribosomal protein L11 methyltransferase
MVSKSMASKTRTRRAVTPAARLETDEQAARRIAALFAETYPAGDIALALHESGAGRWRVTMHFVVPPDRAAVRALTAAAAGPAAAKALRFERVAAVDWVRNSVAALKPVAAGRFIVHGGHDRGRIAPNRIGIEIEAAQAFGTGHHGTTRGCLLALDRICKSQFNRSPVHRHPEVRAKGAPRRIRGRSLGAAALRGSRSLSSGRPLRAGPVGSHLRVTEIKPHILDLGTGSGVLAIAAARALRRRVLATDIDASAVRAARANARLNRAGALVEVLRADGVAPLCVRAPFDVIFANILLGPLQRMAAQLARLTRPGARVILSGLQTAQANAALAAYRGLALERRVDLDGWVTLVLVRAKRPRPAVARRRPAPTP